MSLDLNELRALPVGEKLRIMEALWDDLDHDESPWPVESWQREEVARRRDEMLRDPACGVTHETMWQTLRDVHAQQ